jgi:AraC-like DNA-binding protein
MPVYLTHRPGPPLSQVVNMFWYCEGYDAFPRIERRVPGNSFQIVIDLANNRIPVFDRESGKLLSSTAPTLVVGMPSRFEVIHTASLRCMMGVVFVAGRAPALLRLPVGELENQEVDLSLFLRNSPAELRERLQQAPDPAARFAVLEQMLTRRIDWECMVHPAVPFVVRSLREPGNRKIADLAQQAGLSPRRLTQLFREQVGLTPKLYARIHRLRQVLRTLNGQGRQLDWARLAADCGYYDQAHFAHEFREFTGLTPSEFSARERPWTNHVVL